MLTDTANSYLISRMNALRLQLTSLKATLNPFYCVDGIEDKRLRDILDIFQIQPLDVRGVLVRTVSCLAGESGKNHVQ